MKFIFNEGKYLLRQKLTARLSIALSSIYIANHTIFS